MKDQDDLTQYEEDMRGREEFKHGGAVVVLLCSGTIVISLFILLGLMFGWVGVE